MSLTRKATAFLLLVAIGLPASMGVGLHWLQDACLGEHLAAQTACGPDCPFEHKAPADTDQVSSDGVCLLCDFLATAKKSAHILPPAVTLTRVPTPVCDSNGTLVLDEIPLEVLARGPPAPVSA
jgi:hypothetical protein